MILTAIRLRMDLPIYLINFFQDFFVLKHSERFIQTRAIDSSTEFDFKNAIGIFVENTLLQNTIELHKMIKISDE